MYGMIDPEEPRRHHEELLREADPNRLRKALPANSKGPATSRWASTVAWELMRTAGLLRKYFRMLKNAD